VEILKIGLVIAAGLGSTWAAREATEFLGMPAPQRFVQAPADEGAGAAGAGEAAAPAVPELSREEMDEEFQKAQAEIRGGDKEAELREFRPTKPLPADLPIALPSDI